MKLYYDYFILTKYQDHDSIKKYYDDNSKFIFTL